MRRFIFSAKVPENRRRGLAGFTAAELIVATAVFSILAGMVYQFFKFNAGNQKRLDQDSTALQQANVAMMRMVKEISEARSIIYPAPGSTSASFAVVGRRGTFIFFTLLPSSFDPAAGPVPSLSGPGVPPGAPSDVELKTLYMWEIEAANGPAISSGPPIQKWKKMADRVMQASFTTHEVKAGKVPCMATIQLKVFNNVAPGAENSPDNVKKTRSIDYLTSVFCRAATEVD